MKRVVVLWLLFLGVGMLPVCAFAQETLSEAVERQAKQAEIDYKKIPIFAIAVEALQSGRKFPTMPAEAIEAARAEGSSSVTVGESEVSVNRYRGGYVTFTITPSARSSEDFGGRVHYLWRPDPIEDLIGWVYGAQTFGVVFAKSGDDFSMAIPNFQTCLGILPDGTKNHGIAAACKRFGLGTMYFSKDSESVVRRGIARESFPMYLMANYGSAGVLTRDDLSKALNGHMDSIRAVIKASEDKTGHVRYNPSTGKYSLPESPLLRADVYYPGSVVPGGVVEMTVYSYSEKVAAMQVQLVYSEGKPLAKSAMGNLASAALYRKNMVPETDGLYRFGTVKIDLPPNLLPGQVFIIAEAVDPDGILLLKDEVIGSFKYMEGDEPPAQK